MAESTGAKQVKKSLILNAFVESCSGHQSPGLWRHPKDQSWKFNEIEHWVELAKLLEAAKIHGIFIADVLGKFEYGTITNRKPHRIQVVMMYTDSHWIRQLYRGRNGL
jgi:hypothetical protein